MLSYARMLEEKYGMKVLGFHRTRKGGNRGKRELIAFCGGKYTVKKVSVPFFLPSKIAYVVFEVAANPDCGCVYCVEEDE